MGERTTNHDLYKGDDGEHDIHDELNSNLDHIDATLTIRDVESNKTRYDPVTNAVFVATDTGAIYEGTGTSWTRAGRDMAYARLVPRSAPPSNPRTGMQALADGTNWDGGVGDGTARVVIYDGTGWQSLGSLGTSL